MSKCKKIRKKSEMTANVCSKQAKINLQMGLENLRKFFVNSFAYFKLKFTEISFVF